MNQLFDKKPFVVVDGSSYLFRAYYAMPALTNSSGLPTGAIYGVLNMLQKLINDYSPEYMVVVFDPKGKTTRHEWFPDYKANRSAMPNELAQQIPYLHKAITALGLPIKIESGVEADDLIGTYTKRAESQGLPVLISTGDKDMAQLVNDRVHLINTMKNQRLDIDGVKEKYGVVPEQIIDYLALMGDTSDNIPGVKSVGPKTAVKWIDEYGSLEGIVSNADAIRGKVGGNLKAAIDGGELDLAKQLVTINCDIDCSGMPMDFSLTEPHWSELRELFKELEFTKWLQELEHPDYAATGDDNQDVLTQNYDTILTMEQWSKWHERLQSATVFAFDTETTSIDPMEAELVGFSLSVSPGEAAYIPLAHDYTGAPEQCDRDLVLQQLASILSDKTKTCVGHNLKYDLHILRHSGIRVENQLWDTMIASYVLNPSIRGHKLDTLILNQLGHTMTTFEDVAGTGAKQLTFNQVELDVAGHYAAEDADMTLRLFEALESKIAEEPSKRIFHDIEMPLMSILEDVEYVGVRIDCEMLQQQSADLKNTLTGLQRQIHELAEEEFNIASPKQLQAILFDKMQLPVIKKTPKGQPSTSEEVLQELALSFSLPQLILEFRSAQKLKSTYTDKLPLQVNQKTGRVHTQYNQTVTTTGRLSSNNPNLQNIPVRSAEGRKVRQAFVARDDRVIVAADYSQIELRIMAHLSQDSSLLHAFTNGVDVHSATAADVFSVAVDAVSSEQRRRAKAINFGLIYGMSAFGLAKQLGVGRQDAQQYIDIYFDRYPKVLEYMNNARELAKQQGYVETMLGRRLYTPDINASNGIRRKAAERAAINAPLQGSAADIIKLAMISCAQWQRNCSEHVSLLMQVHDELVFSVESSMLDEVVTKIRASMESAVELSVPLLVDVGVGDSWEAAH